VNRIVEAGTASSPIEGWIFFEKDVFIRTIAELFPQLN